MSFLTAPQAFADRKQETPTGWLWYYGVSGDTLAAQINAGYRITDLEIDDTDPYRFNAVLVKNSGVYESGWWWYYGVSAATLADKLQLHQARILDLETYWVDGQQRFAAILLPNTGADAKGWWWYYNVSTDFIADKLDQNNARLIDIETYISGSTRLYSVAMIANTGADAKSWWWYYNVSTTFIADKLDQNNARIVDIERHGSDTFTVVMERTAGEHWWWYYNLTATQVGNVAKQLGARIIDLESYTISGSRRFAIALLNNSNQLTTRIADILRDNTDGVHGLYLKRVEGSVLASLQSSTQFEPASMIKVLHHTHAMLAVQSGAANLNETITVFQAYNGSCPLDQTPPAFVQESLQQALRRMMQNSDNARTEAVRKRFGQASINATAQNLDMNNTLLQHRIGCGGDALNNPNRLTLVDTGKLYEEVATGLLTPPNRQTFYQLMSNQSNSNLFRSMIDQEAATAGLDASDLTAFKAQLQHAWKGGSYGLNGKQYLTLGGWAQLPYKNCRTGQVEPREYVYGLFINEANSIAPGFSIFTTAEELLRDEIRVAVQTWDRC